MRFRSGDVRLFKGRGSVGVRGIRLKKDDEVISISVLKHIEASICFKTEIDITSSSFFNLMPLTPTDPLPLKSLTSPDLNLMHEV